ncbi:hypothetical protein Q5P01_009491 [Channa striata]|uniref:WD repeat domain 62 n=1 Tax=Channa striata TaxID=64152 RepID=A0AA88SXH8_CHASR|nr:hypothetical protein Q5P01_009491 [Channa striata]
MAEGADCGPANPAKRKQLVGRKSRPGPQKKSSSSRVSLEKVLGICTTSSSSLTSDPKSGLIAYPAGCVIVLLHPKKNRQTHIINTSRKPFSALAFSLDGKYLVTGESGHMPCVRVWEVNGVQVAEVQSHKYGVSCVAFSTNSCYIVSVGYQHDMTVSVWDWRRGSIIASNKVSCRVFAVSFSQDSSYFVTAGNRHVKFWFLDASKERRVNSTVPLIGRSGLLGNHRNSMFCGVACGRGRMVSSTYCITSSGLLCLFNSSRQLESCVNLKTSSGSCLAVSEDFIFCGCADGIVRVFSPSNLQYITTLPRPHRLGVDLTQSTQHSSLLPASPGAHYPDTLALTFDSAARHLTCVYNDHSVYVWDVRDVRNVGKLYSALYHSSCVWSVEVYPELSDMSLACLPPSSFFTCSSDNTIRLWHTDASTGQRNFYSNDLLSILYVGENTQHLQAEGEAAGADGKAGIRVLGISPDGQHLAAGDRCGNLRIFGLEFLDELVKIEAHDSEVLCLEFSPTSTGVKLLASASRDRLIHVFNLEKNYSLEQTLNDHSASITAVKFTGESPEVRVVSCGADKSIYFQTAEQTVEGLSFSRSHHVVEKTTLYDMDVDSTRTHVAVACQDRNIRVYNVETGKLKKCLKGSSSDEGALLKVHMDPSGSFFATSCSDKNISIFDYESGECVATLSGHSEIVTGMRFSRDCRHLITVAGDSCVFVWKLDSQMTTTMRKKLGLKQRGAPQPCSHKKLNIRRETFITVPSSQHRQMEDEKEADLRTPTRLDCGHSETDQGRVAGAPPLQSNGKLPMWFRKLRDQGVAPSAVPSDTSPRQVRRRWTEQFVPLIICSTFSPSPTKSQGEEEEEEEEEGFHPQSLESVLGEEEEEEDGEAEENRVLPTAADSSHSYILCPTTSTTSDREFDIEGLIDPQLEVRGQEPEPVWSTQLSPDSACSEGSGESLEQQHDADTDSLSQGSSVGSLGLEDDDDRNSLKNHFETLASSLNEEKFDTDLRTLQLREDKDFLNPRLSISTRFLSRFQDRLRKFPSRAPAPVSIPAIISEERNGSIARVKSKSSSSLVSTESTQRENGGGVMRQHSVLRRRTSCMISHQPLRRPLRRRHTVVVVQCRDRLGDITSKACSSSIAPAVQQGSLRLGHLEAAASSRAKLIQDSSTQEKDNHSSGPQSAPPLLSAGLDLHNTITDALQNQSSRVSLSSQSQRHVPEERPQALAAPMCWTSLGGVRRRSTSSIDDILTNEKQTRMLASAPCTTRNVPAMACDEEKPKGSETRIHTDPVADLALAADSSSTAPPTSSSCPLSERVSPCQTGIQSPPTGSADDEPVGLQRCEQVANELRRTVRRAIRLYQQLHVSPGAADPLPRMLSVLLEAFDDADSELRKVGQSSRSAPFGRPEENRTTADESEHTEQNVE